MWINQENNIYAYTGGRTFDASLPYVIMLHGAQNDHSVWALQSRWLAHHGYNVLAFDLPGHGRSTGPGLASVEHMAQWVLSQLQSLKVETWHLVGHSMGSLIALELAYQAPQQTLSLALLGTACPMPVSQNLLDMVKQNPSAATHQINAWSHRTSIKAFMTSIPGHNPIGTGYALMNQVQSKHGADVLVQDFNACNNYVQGLTHRASIEAPILVINGINDSMTTAKAASELASKLKNVQLVLLPNCGHALMSEQPDLVLDALSVHLKSNANTSLQATV